jgi:hypothetical protein
MLYPSIPFSKKSDLVRGSLNTINTNHLKANFPGTKENIGLKKEIGKYDR